MCVVLYLGVDGAVDSLKSIFEQNIKNFVKRKKFELVEYFSFFEETLHSREKT